MSAEIKLGKVKKKPSDYFKGTISQNGKVLSEIYGSYMGFCEFDGMRYWDFRDSIPNKPTIIT